MMRRTLSFARPVRIVMALAAVVLLALGPIKGQGVAQAADDAGGGALSEAGSGAWEDIRGQLYGDDREILDGTGVISLDAPDRALDAATVPITIAAGIDQTADRYIKAVTLVIDENPAPVVGTFRLYPDNGIASLSTRVRVNAYTNIRVIAETNDGALYMAKRFVKASGGCSAPAVKNNEEALARLGKMKLKQIGTWRPGEVQEAQFMVSHPNYSGLQTDPVTLLWVPARYVRTIDLSLGDKPILRFEGDISLSENPSIRFFVKPEGEAELKARVVDSDDTVFEQSWPIKLAPVL